MGRLSPFDAQVIDTLRRDGVIEDMNGNGINLSRGVIIIRCPDGDQMLDRIEHDRRVAIEAGVTPRIHLITHHGGSMVVAPNSPLYPNMGIDQYVLEQIREAETLKDINIISAEIHVPCGKAGSLGLTLVHQIALMMEAKPRIKGIDPSNKVLCRIHVDYTDGRKRTYFISRQKWLAFWARRGRDLWGHLFKEDPHPGAIVSRVREVPTRERGTFQVEELDGPSRVTPAGIDTSALAGLQPSGPSTLMGIE